MSTFGKLDTVLIGALVVGVWIDELVVGVDVSLGTRVFVSIVSGGISTLGVLVVVSIDALVVGVLVVVSIGALVVGVWIGTLDVSCLLSIVLAIGAC